MNEQEWLASTDPAAMLSLVDTVWPSMSKQQKGRKLRLFACACCRQVWHALHGGSRYAVEVAERFADGEEDELVPSEDIVSIADAASAARHIVAWAERGGFPARECGPATQAALLREVFGNPFRHAGYARFSEKARRWAEALYADRDFDALPVLADMLEEHDGGPPELLEHFRAPGPHVRGCWALDLLVGKG